MRAPEEGAANLQEYLDLLRRRWLLIVVVTVVVVGCALARTLLATPIYSSQAEILVRSTDTGGFGSGGSDIGNLETERELLLSTAVASRAADLLHGSVTAADLRANASVTIPAGTQVLDVKYSARSPVDAQRGARALADAYLAYRQTRASEAATSVGSVVQQRIDGLQKQLNKARATLADPNASTTDKQEAAVTRDSLIGQLGVLQAQLATISTSEVSPGEVIEPANRPGQPSSPNHVLDLLGGLFLGLILAGAAAVVRDRTVAVSSLGGRQGFERILDRPVLGVIPEDPGWKRVTEPWLVTVNAPDGPVAEAYRTLATKLLVLDRRYDVKTVAFMSAASGEGKSSTAANLSVALVEEGKRVLLISADIRRPRIHQFFGLSDEVGLLNVLADEMSAEDVLQPAPVGNAWDQGGSQPRLYVMASGQAVTQSMRGLGPDALSEFLKLHRDRFDFVLIDSPPALLIADALAIATVADGVLVVADAKTSKPEAVGRLVEQLEHVGARVLGGVLGRDDPPWGGRQHYYRAG
jgi:capsular exopolysaccharide synthesis family protein